MYVQGVYYCDECCLVICAGETRVTFLRPAPKNTEPTYQHFHQYEGKTCYDKHVAKHRKEAMKLRNRVIQASSTSACSPCSSISSYQTQKGA